MKSVNFVDEVEAIPEEGILQNGVHFASASSNLNASHVRRSSNASLDKTAESNVDSSYTDAESREAAKSREEKVRLARERFEAERKRRLEQLMEAQRQAEAFREEQLMMKKRRLQEAREKHLDRRRNVEERRKQMQQEEKAKREELQKKLVTSDRDYRRSISGPSSGSGRVFAFGSCTPRDICTPITRTLPASPTSAKGPKARRAVAKPSRTVISTPDVRTSRPRRGSSDWEPPVRVPRGRGHASLMTGSFTTAMGTPPAALGLTSGPPQVEEEAPMQRAASTTNLNRGGGSARRFQRTTLSAFPNGSDKLDRTVSTPNISQANQKTRSRGKFGGSSRLLENTRKGPPESHLGRSSMERSRSGTLVPSRKSGAVSSRMSSSVSASFIGPSSSLFDRLSQPRRLSTQTEEEPLQKPKKSMPKRPEITVSKTSPKLPRSKTKSMSPKNSQTEKSKNSSKSAKVPSEADDFHVLQPSVVVVVEKGEKSVSSASAEAEPHPDVTERTPTHETEATAASVDFSSAQENHTSCDALSLPSDRVVSPPRTLTLAQTSGDALAVTESPASAKSEPGFPLIPGTVSEEPRGRGLRVPSPAPKLSKGSAPSTPTGQREFPRSPAKEISEEEYKQRLAEQRRLARERLAAQEAEKMRVIEEERKRREEEAQRLREEAERQQKEEEEKKRIEREKQEAEERERQEEEEKKKAEEERIKEEEEKKRQERLRLTRQSLEMMERQREEHQKIEDQHRMERKKRLESIMSRVKKSTDLYGSRESLTSSHLDLSANGDDDRPLSPAPQFKSALLQSMLSKGRLSNSIRAISALRQGQSGSTGSLLTDIRNLSRSSENLVFGANSTADVRASAAGDMTTSQTEDQLSPPPVVNPTMWRSHPNGIPGLSGRDRTSNDDTEKSYGETSIRIPMDDSNSMGSSISGKEGDFTRQTSVRFEEVIQLSHGSDEESWISSSSANREVADLMS